MSHLFHVKKWNAGMLAPLPVPGILVVENVLQMPWFLYFNLHKLKTILMRVPCNQLNHASIKIPILQLL